MPLEDTRLGGILTQNPESPEPGLGQRVRSLREARSWSQADLARASRLSRTYVKAIEDGAAKEPSARTIGLLCRALQVDVIDLMQACGALPLDYYQSPLQKDLDLTMYLRRQRKLSEQFVNTIMHLVRVAELDEGCRALPD